jgi:hypothetical protein
MAISGGAAKEERCHVRNVCDRDGSPLIPHQ